MGVKIRIRRGIVHLVITDGAIRKEITTGLHTSPVKLQNDEVMRLAEILRSKKELQLISEQNGLITPITCKKTLYEQTVDLMKLKGEEAQIHKCLPYLEKFGGKNILLRNINSTYLEELRLKFEREGPASKNTQAKYFGMIKLAIKTAVREGLIPHDPTDGVKGIRTTAGNKVALTVDEVKTLTKTPYTRYAKTQSFQDECRRAFILGCLTGLRISDLVELTYDQIDNSRNVIIKKMEKTDEFVYIPIHADAWELLNYKDSTELVFPALAETSKHDNYKTSNLYLSGWGVEAGIKKHITWHVARHTNATLLIEYGTDIYVVQKLLGHAHVATTMQYAKVSDKLKREAVDNIPKML